MEAQKLLSPYVTSQKQMESRPADPAKKERGFRVNRKSPVSIGWKEHHIMLFDRIAVEKHI